jgi:hypothetical protein
LAKKAGLAALQSFFGNQISCWQKFELTEITSSPDINTLCVTLKKQRMMVKVS